MNIVQKIFHRINELNEALQAAKRNEDLLAFLSAKKNANKDLRRMIETVTETDDEEDISFPSLPARRASDYPNASIGYSMENAIDRQLALLEVLEGVMDAKLLVTLRTSLRERKAKLQADKRDGKE
jgi:hypothetical protein